MEPLITPKILGPVLGPRIKDTKLYPSSKKKKRTRQNLSAYSCVRVRVSAGGESRISISTLPVILAKNVSMKGINSYGIYGK